MAILAGWDYRIKLTIDKDNIDTAAQTNFPVLVYLSASSGITSADVSCVFDELTSDGNRKKIAITSDDGTTELYVEIERWDDANEKAWLWVKVPSVSYDADTELYLYYDADHADNDSHVGDTTDAVTHNVWDANFVGVWHMAQDPNGDAADCIKDSTSNANDGTPAGTMLTADLVDGKVGKALDFDGSDDCVTVADNITFAIPSTITLECIIKSDVDQTTATVQTAVQDNGFGLYFGHASNDDYKGVFGFLDSLDTWYHGDGPVVISKDVYHHFVGSYNDADIKTYLDGAEAASNTIGSVSIRNSTDDFCFGSSDTRNFDGITDEVRLSKIARSAPWIKATYHSNFDSLVTFGAEENVTALNLLDGKISISPYTDLLDGKTVIGSKATDLLDGKVYIFIETTDLLDGKVNINIETTDLLDGSLVIEDRGTDLLDGKIRLKSTATNLLDGKARIKSKATDLLDGKIRLKSTATNLLDGRIIPTHTGQISASCPTPSSDIRAVFRWARIDASVPVPTASFTVGRIIEGDCPVPEFTCNAYPGRNPDLIASAPCPTCSMRVGIALTEYGCPVPTCTIAANTHHLATIYGPAPCPAGTLAADTINIAVITATCPAATGVFETTVGNVASISGLAPYITGSMVGISGIIVSLEGSAPVPGGSLARLNAIETASIAIEGYVPAPYGHITVVGGLTARVLRHIRGEVR